MCGIAGILDLKGRAVEQPVLERLAPASRIAVPTTRGSTSRATSPSASAGSASSTCPAAGSR